MNFAAKLQEETIISRKIKVRRFEQTMLGGYINLESCEIFIQSVNQSCFQFRFNLYFCETQNTLSKFDIQNTTHPYLHQDGN